MTIVSAFLSEHGTTILQAIITGVSGEQYPCKPDIFEKTYELEEIQ